MSTQTPNAPGANTAAPQRTGRDPSGYLTNPPSTVVKVVNTARDDINGLLGIVVSYNLERQRYLVHMTKSQSTMAFKPENIAQGSMREKYVCQWQQLKNDPRVRQKMAQYVREMQHFVAPARLSHVIIGSAVLFLVLLYFVGFSKTIMAVSVIALLAVIAGPDIAAKKPPALIAQNFPNRARIRIEETLPPLRGKLSNNLALGIVLFMVVITIYNLFFTGASSSSAAAASAGGSFDYGSSYATRKLTTSASMEDFQPDISILKKYYEMGFQDAAAGKAGGTSIPSVANMEAELKGLFDPQPLEDDRTLASDDPMIYAAGPPPSSSSSWFDSKNTSSMTNAMSMFYLYRNIMDLGRDSSTGFFSIAQLAANMQHLELWRQGLLILSAYKVLRIFF